MISDWIHKSEAMTCGGLCIFLVPWIWVSEMVFLAQIKHMNHKHCYVKPSILMHGHITWIMCMPALQAYLSKIVRQAMGKI